jgi:hypothetical protein
VFDVINVTIKEEHVIIPEPKPSGSETYRFVNKVVPD